MAGLRGRSRDSIGGAAVLLGAGGVAMLYLPMLPGSPAQAGLTAFLAATAVWLWMSQRHALDEVRVERLHTPRVFEDDALIVTLRVHRGEAMPLELLEVEDKALASLDIFQNHLVPLLPGGWTVQMRYRLIADRHRGLYLLGPLRLRSTDPLGVFPATRDVDHVTSLTIYPRARPLPEYRLPGVDPPLGPPVDHVARIGHGEDVIGVRQYVPGDAPSTVHWRTTARHGRLHVIQRNRPIQSEIALFLDLRRIARYGLGADSSDERAIQVATAILTRVYAGRHRCSLTCAHREPLHISAGSGLAHLHLLLDRLAILNPDGETDFWGLVGHYGLALPRGSRAVAIALAANTPLETTIPLLKRLVDAGVAVDLFLMDEREYIRIYREQDIELAADLRGFDLHVEALRLTGARVIPLRRSEEPALA